MSAYATTQPTRPRHKGLLRSGLRCMDPPDAKLARGLLRYKRNSVRYWRTEVRHRGKRAGLTGRRRAIILDFPAGREFGRDFFRKIGAVAAASEQVEVVFSESCGKLLKFLSACGAGKSLARAGNSRGGGGKFIRPAGKSPSRLTARGTVRSSPGLAAGRSSEVRQLN
jgi:hypothetical protein